MTREGLMQTLDSVNRRLLLPAAISAPTINLVSPTEMAALFMGAAQKLDRPFYLESDMDTRAARTFHAVGEIIVIPTALNMVNFMLNGRFDPKVYLAYVTGIGAASIVELAAKGLYESGLTQPLHRFLKIQDRRTPQLVPGS